jgi:uncharacterized delta-60 repeat protein
MLAALLEACQGLTGRAPRDAAADLPGDVGELPRDGARDDVAVEAAVDVADGPAFDATPCAAPSLRVDGVTDRTVTADSSPDAGVFAASSPRALAADDRGGAYLAGACLGCGTAVRGAVWRVLSATGQTDLAWAAGGRVFDGDEQEHSTEFWSVAVDPAGRVLAGGYARVGGFHWPSLARFTADGQRDLSFGARGRVALEPRRFGVSLSNGFALRVVPVGEAVLLAGVDESPTDQPGTRALLARLRSSDGSLDASFGEGGTLLREDLRGCFDLAAEAGGYVALCQSVDQRPALLRLDARGMERAWAGGAGVTVHAAAPAGMQGRVLLRDSSGAWLAVGAVQRDYADADPPPAVVRFTPEGAPDLSYGVAGLAQLSGVRQTARYTFSSSAALTCDDRLLVGANLDARPLVAALDRGGRLVPSVGERGYLLLPVPRGATVAALTGVAPLPGSARALVLTNFLPAAFSLQSLAP